MVRQTHQRVYLCVELGFWVVCIASAQRQTFKISQLAGIDLGHQDPSIVSQRKMHHLLFSIRPANKLVPIRLSSYTQRTVWLFACKPIFPAPTRTTRTAAARQRPSDGSTSARGAASWPAL